MALSISLSASVRYFCDYRSCLDEKKNYVHTFLNLPSNGVIAKVMESCGIFYGTNFKLISLKRWKLMQNVVQVFCKLAQ